VQREAYLEIMTNDGLSKGMTGVHDARVPQADLAFFKRSVWSRNMDVWAWLIL
jgi:hypothetical protein